LYPEHSWQVHRFAEVPLQFWTAKKNQRTFMDDLYLHLGFKKWSDWYEVKQSQIISFGGTELLKLYKNSVYELLFSVYPEYDWKIWYFTKVPDGLENLSVSSDLTGSWEKLENHRKFFDEVWKVYDLKSFQGTLVEEYC
jgi:hypothetical protein